MKQILTQECRLAFDSKSMASPITLKRFFSGKKHSVFKQKAVKAASNGHIDRKILWQWFGMARKINGHVTIFFLLRPSNKVFGF